MSAWHGACPSLMMKRGAAAAIMVLLGAGQVLANDLSQLYELALSRDGHLVIDTSQPVKADKYLVV